MRIYRSKVDTWLALVLGGSCILPVVIFVLVTLLDGVQRTELIITGVITGGLCVILSAFVVWLYLATKYKVSDTELTINGGLFTETIPFHSIESIIKSNNTLASPAFSLDRLEITYEKTKKILISPKNQDEFLSDIGWDRV